MRRRELRRIARRLHPDVGGDPERYLAAVARLDREHPARTRPQVVHLRRTTGLRALAGRVRRLWRAWIRGRTLRRRRDTDQRLSRAAQSARGGGMRGSATGRGTRGSARRRGAPRP